MGGTSGILEGLVGIQSGHDRLAAGVLWCGVNEALNDVELVAAVQAVALAGRVCRWVQTALGGPRAIIKPDKSPVTIGDYCSQAIVTRTLGERLGAGLVIVSEESADFLSLPENQGVLESCQEALHCSGVWDRPTGPEILEAITAGAGKTPLEGEKNPKPFWTLDPIDGTKGFLRGGQYAVCLALIEDEQPTITALACPNLPTDQSIPLNEPDGVGSIYAASARDPHPGILEWPGDGEHGPARRILRSSVKEGTPPRFARSVEPGHSNREAYSRILERLGDAVISAEIDSQAKYALVARGEADAYMRVPVREGQRENIWDVAPGVLLVRAAGGVATDLHGKELRFGQAKMMHTKGVVACEARTHERVMEAIKELGIG